MFEKNKARETGLSNWLGKKKRGKSRGTAFLFRTRAYIQWYGSGTSSENQTKQLFLTWHCIMSTCRLCNHD